VTLEKLGWNAFFEAEWNILPRDDQQRARITAQHREQWQVASSFGESRAEPSGTLRQAAEDGGDWPAVGDWVAVTGDPATGLLVREVLPRRTQIARKVAGRQIAPQILAANVDTIFVLIGLDDDYNPRRVERYLSQLWDTGARIVLLLNKADLCGNLDGRLQEMQRNAPGVDVLSISASTGQGVAGLDSYSKAGQTIVLLGSSGVGKSTLVNRLLHTEQQTTGPVRASDSRGRHTTTARQLFFLGNGAMIIDTPGLRELQLWDSSEGLAGAFSDIETLAQQCRFHNCHHNGEPGCAVAAAIEAGELNSRRFANHVKLLREEQFLERKLDRSAQQKEKQRIKTVSRAVRQLYNNRDKP
jgi:ribosome biogenesis GTPase / thiamine phosphate phosphatase